MMVYKLGKWVGWGIPVVVSLIFLDGWGKTGAAELLANNPLELNQLLDKAESCKECHKQHFDQWKRSYHAQSLITIIGGMKKFIEEVEKEKGRFPNKKELLGCFDCHAPTLRFASEKFTQQVARMVVEGKKEELAEFRVECSYCHTVQVTGKTGKNVYYGPIENPEVTTHESKYAPEIADSEMCRSCHQSFYKLLEVYCSTVYESWRGTQTSRDKECQFCHMKAYDGTAAEMDEPIQRVVHDHTFPGGHFPSILQEAVKLNLTARKASPKVTFTVSIKNLAGHHFPDT